MSNRPGGFVITKDSKIVHFPPSRENYSSFYQQRVETDTKDQVPSNWLFAFWGDDYHDSFHYNGNNDVKTLRFDPKNLISDELSDTLSTVSGPFDFDIKELRYAMKDQVRYILMDVLSTIPDPYIFTDNKFRDDNEDELFILQFPCEYTTFEYSIPYCSDVSPINNNNFKNYEYH